MADPSRKSISVWLKPLHQRMMAAMPDVNLGEIVRQSIEEWFQGRNDREFARVVIEDDLEQLVAQWDRVLGVNASYTVTATEDGFRVVVVALKDYDG